MPGNYSSELRVDWGKNNLNNSNNNNNNNAHLESSLLSAVSPYPVPVAEFHDAGRTLLCCSRLWPPSHLRAYCCPEPPGATIHPTIMGSETYYNVFHRNFWAQFPPTM